MPLQPCVRWLGRHECAGLLVLDDAPASFNGGVVEDVFEGEEEGGGEHRLGDLGRDACWEDGEYASRDLKC